MFGSDVLEVAIGVIFIYLLLSLVCSATVEIFEAWLKMRASDLEQGIRELLDDSKGTDLAKRLYEHPLVYALFRGKYKPGLIRKGRYPRGSELPSYIPARTFALALMDIVLPPSSDHGGKRSEGKESMASFRKALGKMENPMVKTALHALVDEAGDDIDKTRENIEKWYNSAMDRVSGWYKRRTQVALLVIGFIIAVAVNADTISIGNSLASDRALREGLAAAAQQYAKDSEGQTAKATDENVRRSFREIGKLGFPMGWNTDDSRTVPDTLQGWATKLVGWLLTAMAVSLGAPFWFDLLNKIVVVRSTVKSS